MNKKVYYFILGFIVIISMVSGFEIINMAVSLKYETVHPNECISKITGADLCATIKAFKIIFFACITILIDLIMLEKRIITK